MADEEDIAFAKLAADFLEQAGSRDEAAETKVRGISETLAACAAAASISSAADLGHLLHVSRITAWYWLNDRAVPSFPHALRICHTFNISLSDFLLGNVPAQIAVREPVELPLRPGRASSRKFDEVRVATQIDSLCDARATRPPSMLEIGELTGYAPRLLRQHFPKRCREISARHRAYLRDDSNRRQDELREAFRQAIQQSRRELGRVRRCEVVSYLQKPGILRSKAARKLFDQLLLEFDR